MCKASLSIVVLLRAHAVEGALCGRTSNCFTRTTRHRSAASCSIAVFAERMNRNVSCWKPSAEACRTNSGPSRLAAGVGAGASGASAGLLHPYTPRGKLLWRGEECMAAAMDLVAAAEAAVQRRTEPNGEPRPSSSGAIGEPFVWRQPIMRPAVSAKQVSCFSARPAGNLNPGRVFGCVSAATGNGAPASTWKTV